jgi:hypothetical protein
MSRSPVLSLAALRSAWMDPSLTAAQVAARFGIGARTLSDYVIRYGWPARGGRNRQARLRIEVLRPLYDAGLSMADIARIVGARRGTVQSYLWRHGFRRGADWRPALTLQDWQAQRLAVLAAAERRAAQARDGRSRWPARPAGVPL